MSGVCGLSSDSLLRVVVTRITYRWCSISLRGRRAGRLNHLRRCIGGLLTVSAIITVEILATVPGLCGKGRRCIVVLEHGWWARIVGP